ncbi:MAG TPA: universal stress protein [Polyangia bacterium]|nr:universal stress protein [Polyangia bacterium]
MLLFQSRMGTILCATDFSPASAAVTSVAAAFSRLSGFPVELFHVFQTPASFAPNGLDELETNDLRTWAEERIAAQAETLRGTGIGVRTSVALAPSDEIAAHARAIGANLLVLGTHGRKGPLRFLLGSVAEQTIRTAHCPILIVPQSAAPHRLTRARPGTPLKVVVGIDFSPASDAALAWLRGLLDLTPCEVRLVHLYVPAREHERLGFDPPMPFEVNREVVDILARDLRVRVHAAVGTDFALRVRPNWGGEDDPLAWEAETDEADLLVIGTSQTRHSTALATVRGAHLPVVCVPRLDQAPKPERLAPVRSILAVTDFSPVGNAAVREAYRLLLPAGGDVVLTHVAKPDRLGLEPSRQEELETCLLGLVPQEIDRAGIRTRTFVTSNFVPSEAILKAINRFEPDLVVMAAHGDASARRGGHGMVTEDVVWNSPKPVVIVPSAAQEPS